MAGPYPVFCGLAAAQVDSQGHKNMGFWDVVGTACVSSLLCLAFLWETPLLPYFVGGGLMYSSSFPFDLVETYTSTGPRLLSTA